MNDFANSTYDRRKLSMVSDEFTSSLLSGDEGLVKRAGMATNDYFRTEIRENGVYRRLLPPTVITDANLAENPYNDLPCTFAEIEFESSGAMQVPFEAGTTNDVLHGRKVFIDFHRVFSPNYGIDMIRLKSYKMPIMDILRDNMLKSIMDQEDATWKALDDYILGEVNTDNKDLGCRRNITVGPIGRESLVAAKKAMSVTPGNLIAAKGIMNYLTYSDIGILTKDQIGGTTAEDMFYNGVTTTKLYGLDIITTIKRDLWRDNELYIYPEPRYYGMFCIMDDVTLITDIKDGYWLEVKMWEMIGGAIVNAAGVAKVSFTGTLEPWDNQA